MLPAVGCVRSALESAGWERSGARPTLSPGMTAEAAGFLRLRLRFLRLRDLFRVELAWEWEPGGGVSRC